VTLRLSLPPERPDASEAGGPTARALAALDARLEALAPARRTRLTVVVGGALVRYRIVPWNPAAGSSARRTLFAQHCFHDAYGEPARAWSVRADAPRHGRPVLACAIETALLDGAVALAQRRGLVLDRIQPSLMPAFNAARRTAPAQTFWLALAEGGVLTVLLVVEGSPALVKVQGGGADDVQRLLAREWFATGREAASCPLYLVDETGDPAAATGRWLDLSLGSPATLLMNAAAASAAQLQAA
jgi:hypothetical protein